MKKWGLSLKLARAKALRLSQPALFGVIKKSELSLSPDTSTSST